MSTRYLAAYALASLSNPTPSQENIEAICKAVNVPVDANDLAFTLEAIANRDVASLIAEGAAKKSASAAAAAAPAGGAAAPAAAAAASAAAEEKKKEEEEEDDDEMGFGLFD